jgi:hypothetical protein
MTRMTENAANLNMVLTPDMEKMMKDFPWFLEIEMLEADRRVLSDGRIEYKNVVIADDEKAELLKEFVLKMISHSHISNDN